ncbi:MAG: hypothetical protein V1833_00890 [Elusimicrobiota bacterium]
MLYYDIVEKPLFVIPECRYRESISVGVWIPAFAGMTLKMTFSTVSLYKKNKKMQ